MHNKHLCALLLGFSIVATTARCAPDAAVPSHDPVIVLMDTSAPRGIYDPDNVAAGRSNADELYKGLAGLDGIVSQKNMYRERIGLDWARDSFVAALHPGIVIIHRSSFFHPIAAQLKLGYPPFANEEEQRKWQAIYDTQDGRLRSFIRLVGAAEPHTQFVIYSRGTDRNWLDDKFRANWLKQLELELPALEGRINTMVIPNGPKGTFRDPATMEALRRRVSEMLKKLEGRKSEKRN